MIANEHRTLRRFRVRSANKTNKLETVRFLWSLLPFICASDTGFRQYQILRGLEG